MALLGLWQHVLDHLQAVGTSLDDWRNQSPARLTDRDLLEEYGWVVISCGLSPAVSFKLWPGLTEAFRNWDPALVDRIPVRVAALGVIKSPRKVDAILDFADSLSHEPGQMQRLATMDLKQALHWLGTLPWVGQNNRYHMARNLGFDCPVRTGPVSRLTAYVGMEQDELVEKLAQLTGERVRTVDLALWKWSFDIGDAEAKRWAGLFIPAVET